MFSLKETKAVFVCDIQVRQCNASIQPVTLLCPVYMDGAAFVGEVPGLGVDRGGGKAGGLQSGIGCIRDLLYRLSFEAFQVVAQRITLRIAEGQHNNEFHIAHSIVSPGIHSAHTKPADTQTQSLQIQIHLLEQEADVLQVAFLFLYFTSVFILLHKRKPVNKKCLQAVDW